MASHQFSDDLDALRRHYTTLLERHGDGPQALQWSNRATQERRMAILAEIGDLRRAKILDFGCGTGHLLGYLRENHGFEGEYVGYDLAPELLKAAEAKFPGVRFEARDILTDPSTEKFDYVLISGVFNNLLGDNWQRMTAILQELFPLARKGLAFNALSNYVDFQESGLYYANPEAVFRFCKEQLSALVTLRHDYQVKPDVIPFEFTVYVHATPLPRRPRSQQ